jgi:hypothetical protein
VKVIVSHALGVQTADDLEQAEDTARCADCGGRGYVRTGSLVPDFESAMCLACQGRGWVATDERRRVLIGQAPNGATNAQTLEPATHHARLQRRDPGAAGSRRAPRRRLRGDGAAEPDRLLNAEAADEGAARGAGSRPLPAAVPRDGRSRPPRA